jgi:hypothetical protein
MRYRKLEDALAGTDLTLQLQEIKFLLKVKTPNTKQGL